MAYTIMTPEQYVVNELQDMKIERAKLLQEIDLLREARNEKDNVLYMLCNRLKIEHSDIIGDYLNFDTLITEHDDPTLVAKVKWIMENKGGD